MTSNGLDWRWHSGDFPPPTMPFLEYGCTRVSLLYYVRTPEGRLDVARFYEHDGSWRTEDNRVVEVVTWAEVRPSGN